METKRQIVRSGELPILPLRGLVVFPGMQIHFDVGRKRSLLALKQAMENDQTIFLLTQAELSEDVPEFDHLYQMGVVAKIRQVMKLSGETMRVMVEGQYRAKVRETITTEPYYSALVRECRERRMDDPLREEALIRECRTYFSAYAALAQSVPQDVRMAVASENDAGLLADYIAAYLPMPVEDKQAVLEAVQAEKRMRLLLLMLQEETEILELEQSIHQQVQEAMDRHQREYYLREQLRVISSELGEGDNPVEEAEEYRAKIAALSLPEEAAQKLERECEKLAKMPYGSHEATVVRNYLDTCLALPWTTVTKDHLQLGRAEKLLNKEHYGLTKVKERILETLAVRSLKTDIKGQVLCLIGPPGVGKSSIARSVAAAMGRKFVRVSLGGVKDESEIRGHRRTYIGAMPGRIIDAMRQAGSRNPVILLDEIDKMGNDFRGDPTAALLEVLDGEQNAAFLDHYLDIPFDLSDVLFITTANDAEGISAPLLDRMERITLSSYTAEEKREIARRHLIDKQLKKHGLTRRQLPISDEAIDQLIDGYTREAGVRQLERLIATLCRKAAKQLVEGQRKTVPVTPADLETYLGPRKFKAESERPADEVGVVNGLAWTAVGGEMMPVEVSLLEGSGKVKLTGSLGDVMKESAFAAISFVRSRAGLWDVDREFYKNKDIHIHVPEGAVPKDGPSAGVTMATAIVSALTGIPVRADVAMTGEITLRGRVLPIGGLKEKTMAAYTHHMKTVLIPEDNAADLAEIEPVVRNHIRFVPVRHMDQVMEEALQKPPCPAKPGARSCREAGRKAPESAVMSQ